MFGFRPRRYFYLRIRLSRKIDSRYPRDKPLHSGDHICEVLLEVQQCISETTFQRFGLLKHSNRSNNLKIQICKIYMHLDPKDVLDPIDISRQNR